MILKAEPNFWSWNVVDVLESSWMGIVYHLNN